MNRENLKDQAEFHLNLKRENIYLVIETGTPKKQEKDIPGGRSDVIMLRGNRYGLGEIVKNLKLGELSQEKLCERSR